MMDPWISRFVRKDNVTFSWKTLVSLRSNLNRYCVYSHSSHQLTPFGSELDCTESCDFLQCSIQTQRRPQRTLESVDRSRCKRFPHVGCEKERQTTKETKDYYEPLEQERRPRVVSFQFQVRVLREPTRVTTVRSYYRPLRKRPLTPLSNRLWPGVKQWTSTSLDSELFLFRK